LSKFRDHTQDTPHLVGLTGGVISPSQRPLKTT